MCTLPISEGISQGWAFLYLGTDVQDSRNVQNRILGGREGENRTRSACSGKRENNQTEEGARGEEAQGDGSEEDGREEQEEKERGGEEEKT